MSKSITSKVTETGFSKSANFLDQNGEDITKRITEAPKAWKYLLLGVESPIVPFITALIGIVSKIARFPESGIIYLSLAPGRSQ